MYTRTFGDEPLVSAPGLGLGCKAMSEFNGRYADMTHIHL